MAAALLLWWLLLERCELPREGGGRALVCREREFSREGGFRERERCELAREGGFRADRESEFSREGGFRERERCELAREGGFRADRESEFSREGGFRCAAAREAELFSRQRERCEVTAGAAAAAAAEVAALRSEELLRDGGFRERERCEVTGAGPAVRSAELLRDGGFRVRCCSEVVPGGGGTPAARERCEMERVVPSWEEEGGSLLVLVRDAAESDREGAVARLARLAPRSLARCNRRTSSSCSLN